MIEDFLQLYNEELHELRKQGEAFAEAHPKIAGRLRLGQGNVEDPLVGRLMESFAFLTARLRHKQNVGLDQVVDNIINMLYPHYLLPVPCCSTLQFSPKDQLNKDFIIPAKTVIETDVDEMDPCYFTTCYPVKLWPINLSEASYGRKMIVKPNQYTGKELKSCLYLKLTTINPDISLADLNLDEVRFFIKAESREVNLIYQLLMKHTKEIIINGNNLPVSIITPVGFSDQEGLLPYPPHSFKGFSLLTEFFAFAEKFFYFDLRGLNEYIHADMGNEIEIYFYFDEVFVELEKLINKDNFVLGCTPVVNIFESKGEPIIIDQKQSEYHVIADAHRGWEGIEVYAIKGVDINSAQHDKEITCSPYFGKKFTSQEKEYCLYWHTFKKACWELGDYYLAGYESFLSFSNIGYLQDLSDNIIVTPDLLCTNRELPTQLPFGGDKPKLRFWHTNYELVESMRCITAITPPRYRDKNKVASCDLASHLFLNQICFANGSDTLRILQDNLALYHYDDDYDNSLVRNGLLAVETKMVTERHPETLRHGFCKGIELTITIDENYFAENNMYLFGCILHEFLTRSCSLNSFIRLILKNNRGGEIHRWKARLGIKPIL
jgi:type VI secretion system protein ImpG